MWRVCDNSKRVFLPSSSSQLTFSTWPTVERVYIVGFFFTAEILWRFRVFSGSIWIQHCQGYLDQLSTSLCSKFLALFLSSLRFGVEHCCSANHGWRKVKSQGRHQGSVSWKIVLQDFTYCHKTQDQNYCTLRVLYCTYKIKTTVLSFYWWLGLELGLWNILIFSPKFFVKKWPVKYIGQWNI